MVRFEVPYYVWFFSNFSSIFFLFRFLNLPLQCDPFRFGFIRFFFCDGEQYVWPSFVQVQETGNYFVPTKGLFLERYFSVPITWRPNTTYHYIIRWTFEKKKNFPQIINEWCSRPCFRYIENLSHFLYYWWIQCTGLNDEVWFNLS